MKHKVFTKRMCLAALHLCSRNFTAEPPLIDWLLTKTRVPHEFNCM